MRRRIVRKNKKRLDPRYFLHENAEETEEAERLDEFDDAPSEPEAPEAAEGDLNFPTMQPPQRAATTSALNFVKKSLDTEFPQAWAKLQREIAAMASGMDFIRSLETTEAPTEYGDVAPETAPELESTSEVGDW